MAVKWATKNGNWEDSTVWNGGTLPGPNDDTYADGKTVTINSSITVKTLRTTQRSGGTAGGRFYVTEFFLTVIAESFIAGTTTCILDEGAGNTYIGNAYGGNGVEAAGITVFGYGTPVTFIGNSYAGSGDSAGGLVSYSPTIQIGNSYGPTATVASSSPGTLLATYPSIHVGNSYGSNADQGSLESPGTYLGNLCHQLGNAYGGTGIYGVATNNTVGLFYGDAIGGSALGAYGVVGGFYNFCNRVEGHTANAFGVKTQSVGFFLSKESVGDYASSIEPDVYTDDTYLPFLSYNSPTSTPTPGKIAKALASKFN